MKKNFSVEINGHNFVIDKSAYESLDNYLEELRQHFSNEESADEIINDIEARIEELLSSRLGSSNRSITIEDVDYVIKTIGRVRDIDNELQDENDSSTNHKEQEYIPRKLYRDIDNNYIGGVCAGLARYLNIDTSIVRLVFVVFLMFGTASLWIYVIMWIVIPAAKTNTQRLEMNGKSPSIDNIEEQIRNKASQMKDDIFNSKKQHIVKEKIRSSSDAILNIITFVLRIFCGMIGVGLGIATIAVAVVFILGSLSIIPMDNFYSVQVFEIAMQSSSYLAALCISAGLSIALPIAFVSYVCNSFAFTGNVKLGTTWTVIGVCWFVALITIIGLVSKI